MRSKICCRAACHPYAIEHGIVVLPAIPAIAPPYAVLDGIRPGAARVSNTILVGLVPQPGWSYGSTAMLRFNCFTITVLDYN